MNGSVELVTRPRRTGGGAATASTGAGGGVRGGRGCRGRAAALRLRPELLEALHQLRILSQRAVISVLRASISAFHLATRGSEPTTVEASLVSRFAE